MLCAITIEHLLNRTSVVAVVEDSSLEAYKAILGSEDLEVVVRAIYLAQCTRHAVEDKDAPSAVVEQKEV